jgi:hypothetical protein
MFGNRKPLPPETAPWHAHAGDAIEDSRNVPGILLFMIAVGALGATLVAAGGGFTGWTIIGAVVTTVALLTAVCILAIEHGRQRAYERRHGRPGHNPMAR